jgi:hypothetical protein
MSKFSCQNERCKILHEHNEEDIRLVLHIVDGVVHQYYVNDDGSLEHYDSDGTGQETFMECKVCGERYGFDYDIGNVYEQHVLPLNKREISELEVVKSK